MIIVVSIFTVLMYEYFLIFKNFFTLFFRCKYFSNVKVAPIFFYSNNIITSSFKLTGSSEPSTTVDARSEFLR